MWAYCLKESRLAAWKELGVNVWKEASSKRQGWGRGCEAVGRFCHLKNPPLRSTPLHLLVLRCRDPVSSGLLLRPLLLPQMFLLIHQPRPLCSQRLPGEPHSLRFTSPSLPLRSYWGTGALLASSHPAPLLASQSLNISWSKIRVTAALPPSP